MKANKFLKIGCPVVIAVALALMPQAFFTVDEREQVIVTQLGEYVRTINTPGLAIKLPLIQTVTRFDRRVLATDAPQAEYLSQDKKRLIADPDRPPSTARLRPRRAPPPGPGEPEPAPPLVASACGRSRVPALPAPESRALGQRPPGRPP